ncbi:MAG TPA: Na+/H+ antiporter [Acetobacteraceae bacterium]|nr:Na+/H+ antiporter [Acetobacteraceae bacterium]
MPLVEALLLLTAACVVLALVARRLALPYAVMLIAGGMVLAFIPGLPRVELDPQIALAFFLPPLLQASAYRTDWKAFRGNLRPILLLAVGCVLFTALVIAAVAKLLIPGLPWMAALALGAIVAPPDAVAAAAVLQRVRAPRRIVSILEGESLINDATALVLYRFAVAAVGVGSIAVGQASLAFLGVALGGIAIGYAIGHAMLWAITRLEDTLLETVVSFLGCFAAFILAEWVHASGVFAVVVAGAVLGRGRARFSARTRADARTVWNFIEFVLTSLVFILIGLALNGILDRLAGRSPLELAALALALSAALILSRFAWIYPVVWLQWLVPAIRRRNERPTRGHLFVLSWAGMRGVVSLAAALALPADFPERDLIVFLAFCAILATLVLQGTTLEWVIRRAGIEEPRRPGMHPEEARARHAVAEAMRQEMERQAGDELQGAIARDILPEYRDRARLLGNVSHGPTAAERQARLSLRLAALAKARERLIAHRDEHALAEEIFAALEQELDLEELRLRRLLGTEGH